jgi:hypothetical protein
MRTGFLCAFAILACSIAAPACATITYELNFDVNATMDSGIVSLRTPATVDLKLTSNGPATQASNVINIPFTVFDVTVTAGNPILNALLPLTHDFIDNLFRTSGGATFSYDIDAHKVSFADQFSFVTTSPVNIVVPPFTTGGQQAFLDFTAFSSPFGTLALDGEIRSFSATGDPIAVAAVPEASTWAMMLLGFCGLGLLAARGRRGALRLA